MGRSIPAKRSFAREPGNRERVTITPNTPVKDYVSYTSLGVARMNSGALQMGTFVLCLSGRPEVHVVLANSGRARIEKMPAICP